MIYFYEFKNETELILAISSEYFITPIIGDYVIIQECKYRVIERYVNYDNRIIKVYLERIN